MKIIKPAILLSVVSLFWAPVFGQLWKQYADSASYFQQHNDIDKAIDFYSKSSAILKRETPSTINYASICDSLGMCYFRKGNLQEAEIQFIEAKETLGKVAGKRSNAYAGACYNLARIYHIKGLVEKAESLYIEAKQIREIKLSMYHPDKITMYISLADLYLDIGLDSVSVYLFLHRIQLLKEQMNKKDPGYFSVCMHLGDVYMKAGMYAKKNNGTDPWYRAAEALFFEAKGKGGEVPNLADDKNYSDAFSFMSMGQYTKAEALLIEIKQAKEKLLSREHPQYLKLCIDLGYLYLRMGQYEKAVSCLVEAREIWETVINREHPKYIEICKGIANAYMRMGQYDKAERFLVMSKKLTEKWLGKNFPTYNEICADLGDVYIKMGQLAKAELAFSEVNKVDISYHRALLYVKMGQYEKAETLLIALKQSADSVKDKDPLGYSKICTDLGNVYMNMDKYEEAELNYTEAKKITEKILGTDNPNYAVDCNSLGNVYELMGQYAKAEVFFIEAKQLQEKLLGKDNSDYAKTCSNLAGLYTRTEQYEKAEPLYLEVKNARERWLGKDHPDYLRVCIGLAGLYMNTRQYEKAEPLLIEALNIQFVQIQKVFQFTSESEKHLYLKRIANFTDLFFLFTRSANSKNAREFAYDVSLTSRNLILSSSQQLRQAAYNTADTTVKKIFTNWSDIKTQLAYWYSKPVAQRTIHERIDTVKTLEEKASALEKELTRLSEAFKTQQQKKPITWKDIQQSLESNEAAIEFVEFNYRHRKNNVNNTYYIALIVRKDLTEPAYVNLFEQRTLDTLLKQQNTKEVIAAFYSRGNSKKLGSVSATKHAYDLIWLPLLKYLNGINKIYFAPSGLLHRIAFAALPVNDQQLLSDKYQLIQLSTTATVTDKDASFAVQSDKAALYGGIQYTVDSSQLKQAVQSFHVTTELPLQSLPEDLYRGGSWKYLPGTEQEVAVIEKFGKENGLSWLAVNGVQANEESFKALSGIQSPAIIHVATHGFFFPDPGKQIESPWLQLGGKAFRESDNPLFRSGLLFAGANHAWQNKPIEGIDDGILTAYEVSNLYLPNTKLVVLSACETGLGDIQGSEGVYGLQRAFKMAGVQNLIMSLWKVPDNETAEFMQEFYKSLFAKQSISDAFYNAQKVMKNKYRDEPHKWASWVLVR